MARVTNYFETQIKIIEDPTVDTSAAGGKSSKPLPDDGPGLIQWYSRILEGVRLRYRKLQRFARLDIFLNYQSATT